jgi:dTDP-glucose 4,6-dehydratase
VVNIGSNYEVSIGDTVNLIADILGSKIEIATDAQRIRPVESEVERLWADNTKAKRMFSWSPRYSGLEGFREGLTETIDWFSNQENLSRYKSHIYNV